MYFGLEINFDDLTEDYLWGSLIILLNTESELIRGSFSADG